MVNFKHLRTSLTFLMSLIITFFFLTAGIITYNLNKRLTAQNINTIHEGITNKVLIMLDSYLSTPHMINDLNEAYLKIESTDILPMEHMRQYFHKELSIYKTANLIAFGTSDGDYTEAQRLGNGKIRTGNVNRGKLELWETGNNGEKLFLDNYVPEYDPRSRPWYKSAVESNERGWSDIYLFSSTGEPAISGNQPYYSEDGRLRGVLTTSVTLEGISEFLRSISPVENTSVLLIDPEGYAVATSGDIPLLDNTSSRISAADLADPVMAAAVEVFDKIKAETRSISYNIAIGSSHYKILSTPYKGPYNLEWDVLVIISEEIYMQAFSRAGMLGITAFLIFLVLSVLMSYLIMSRITNPLGELSSLAEQISWKDSDSWSIPARLLERKDELGTLSSAFLGTKKRINNSLTALQESRKEYQNLVENINSIIMKLKPDGTITYCNPFGLEFYGYKAEELIGEKVQDTVLNTKRPEHLGILEMIFRQDDKFWNGTNKNVTADGREVWILWSNTMLYDSSGEIEELLSIGQDITARIKAEEKLRLSLEEKNILLSEIHHRVKNNLQLTTSLINIQLADIKDQGIREMIQSLQSRLHSMALVHEMLYSTESISEINFHDYLDQIITTVSSYNNHPGLRIETVLKGEPVFMSIENSTTCGLIVNELLLNSFKHAFDNREEGVIEVSIHQNDNGVITLKIMDNGRGISENETLPDKAGGIGYLLIHNLVEQINGTMEIHGGNGTCITVTFRN